MWKQLLKDLIDSGMTQTQIAERIGGGQATISGALNGTVKDLPGRKAIKLIDLHRRTMKKIKKAA